MVLSEEHRTARRVISGTVVKYALLAINIATGTHASTTPALPSWETARG